jgi:hypothetical protein
VTECTLETEPNDTVETAQAMSCAMTGAIGVAGDVDFFTLGAHPPGSRLYAMAEGAASNDNDFDLRVTTASRTLEYDDLNLDSPFGGTAPVIAGTSLNGEPSYLRVNHYASTVRAEPYVLYSAVQTGAPTPETEPNQDMASATEATNNYFVGSITNGTNEFDVYGFTANAGDLVFAALDAVPDRSDAGIPGFNFAMELIDSNNTRLVRVDDNDSASSIQSQTDGGFTATSPNFPGEGLTYRIRATGRYGIRVSKTSGANPNAYHLSISVGCADLQPALTGVSPNVGTPSGGQLVTLTGTNLNARTVVRFGNAFAQVTSVSPFTVLTPSSAPGEVAVTVSNGVGLSSSLAPGYTFIDPPGVPPTLAALTPSVGPVTGGTTVTLSGTVFRPGAAVVFEVNGAAVNGTNVMVVAANRITAVTPPNMAGAATVKVINTDGLEATLLNGFTFQGPPAVTSITPNVGPTGGGTSVTMVGTNFRVGTTVQFGTSLATNVVPAPDGRSLTASTPAVMVNGPVNVTLRTTDGQSVNVPSGFTYIYAAPTLTAVSPSSGFATGGQPITLTGTNFLAGPTVTVGGMAATNVQRVSSTQVTATTPSGTAGLVDITLTNSDLQSVTLGQAFRYIPSPAVTSIAPANGPVQGGTRITVTGSNFAPGATVRIGGVPAFAVTVTGPTTLTAVTNAAAAGPSDVRVTNPDGQSATLSPGFTFDAAPTLSGLSVITGTTSGGTTVELTGSGFIAGAAVFFGTTEATAVAVVSPALLTAVTPQRSVGVVSVTVRNQDNQRATLERAFRFVDPPTVTTANPNAGDVTGGVLVRITGRGFSATTTVSFGGTPSPRVTFVSSSELEAQAPAHGPGTFDIVASTDGAIGTLPNAFTYTRSAPTLAAIAPVSGAVTGGASLTLVGSGFAPGASITVDGQAATGVVVVSDVLARAVAPAHAAGTVDIVFTNDDAQSATLPGGFTYVAVPQGAVGPDGGSRALGTDPEPPTETAIGLSCGCSAMDGSFTSLASVVVWLVFSRRRRILDTL